MRSFAVGTLAR